MRTLHHLPALKPTSAYPEQRPQPRGKSPGAWGPNIRSLYVTSARCSGRHFPKLPSIYGEPFADPRDPGRFDQRVRAGEVKVALSAMAVTNCSADIIAIGHAGAGWRGLNGLGLGCVRCRRRPWRGSPSLWDGIARASGRRPQAHFGARQKSFRVMGRRRRAPTNAWRIP